MPRPPSLSSRVPDKAESRKNKARGQRQGFQSISVPPPEDLFLTRPIRNGVGLAPNAPLAPPNRRPPREAGLDAGAGSTPPKISCPRSAGRQRPSQPIRPPSGRRWTKEGLPRQTQQDPRIQELCSKEERSVMDPRPTRKLQNCVSGLPPATRAGTVTPEGTRHRICRRRGVPEGREPGKVTVRIRVASRGLTASQCPQRGGQRACRPRRDPAAGPPSPCPPRDRRSCRPR